MSIIITCYNYAEYVEAAIQSALKQTYKNIELIIIDDGSTDGSADVIRKHKESARIVSRENKGIVYTRNEALRIAKGDYICFLDADDYFDRDYIENTVKLAEETGADVVFPNWHVFGDKEYKTDFAEFDVQRLIRQEIHCTSESLVRKSAIGHHRFESEQVAEDWDFFLGLALDGRKFKLARNIYINYRVRQNTRGTTRSYWDDMHHFCAILLKWSKKYPDQVNPSDLPVFAGKSSSEYLNNTITEKNRIIDEQAKTIDSIQESISKIKKSFSYRIGLILTAPFRVLHRLIK